jgi:hypothetical protein
MIEKISVSACTIVAVLVLPSIMVLAEEVRPPRVKHQPGASEPAPTVGIVNDLNSKNPELRETAARTLIEALQEPLKKAAKPYLAEIINKASCATDAVRNAGITELAALLESSCKGNRMEVPAWLDRIVSKEATDREETGTKLVTLLNDVLESKFIDKQVENLGSADPAVSVAAEEKLKSFGAAAVDSLVDGLENEQAAVKKGAAEVLKALGPKAKEGANSLAFLLDNDDRVTRRLAAAVLENLGPDAAEVVSDLINYLDNDDKSVRRLAATILKKVGPGIQEAANDLAELLTNDDKNTRSLAAEILMSLGPNATAAARNLGDMLDNQANDADARAKAAAVLGVIGPDSKIVLHILRKYINDPNAAVAKAAQEAVGKIEVKK